LSKTSTASLTDTLTIAGKGVVSGLFNGVIGVVKNPINGKLILTLYLEFFFIKIILFK
jgi:hypothetical protein